MSVIDWLIIAAFFCILVWVGMKFSKKNKNMEDYFLGGRSMPTWLVVLAASGTSISAGTFVGSPELGFNTNLTYLLFNVGGVIGGLFAALFVLPKLYHSKTITIYGYIGDRYDETAKRSTSVMFLIGQLFTSGSRLFIAALAMSVMIFGGINFAFIVYSIIILGVLSTIYTMLGGIKGLIYIDAFQMVIICLTGIVAVWLIAAGMPDGMTLSGIMDVLRNGQVKAGGEWIDANKLQVFDFSLDLSTPYNMIGIFIACSVFHFAKYSTDHEFVQRQLTCKSVKGAAKSLVWSQAFNIPVVFIFMCIGMLLYVLYSQPGYEATMATFMADGRDLFPQFIRCSVPTALRGFMIVGLLAAALSSYNSAINAMASSFTADIILPIRKAKGKATDSDADSISSSKKMVLLMGLILTAFAIFTAFMQQNSGLNLVDFATGIMAFAYSGMLGVFCTALFTKRGNSKSVLWALVSGLVVVLLCQPYVLGPLSEALCGHRMSLAWPWWTVFGAIVSFVVCVLGKPSKTAQAAA